MPVGAGFIRNGFFKQNLVGTIAQQLYFFISLCTPLYILFANFSAK